MKLKTINALETASICNFKCPYCPAPIQSKWRDTGVMSLEVFEQGLEWVQHCLIQGTQKELNLFGMGEPLLNKNIVQMVKRAREVMPYYLDVHLNTNGKLMTRDMGQALKDAGISHIHVTGHDHRETAKTLRIFRELNIKHGVSYDFAVRPNNWAGQVDWFEPEYEYPCTWIPQGQVFILSDGDITTCCLDAAKKGVVGNIFTSKPDDIELVPYDLCKGCHQTL